MIKPEIHFHVTFRCIYMYVPKFLRGFRLDGFTALTYCTLPLSLWMKYYPKITLMHPVRCSAWRDCGTLERGKPVTEQVFETRASHIKFRKSLVLLVGMES